MDAWKYPTLLADVGGTNIRFAICRAAHAAPELLRVLSTAAHRSLAEAAEAYLALVVQPAGGSLAPPRSAAFAVATPIAAARSRAVRLTNTDFTIDGRDLIGRLGLEALWLLRRGGALVEMGLGRFGTS